MHKQRWASVFAKGYAFTRKLFLFHGKVKRAVQEWIKDLEKCWKPLALYENDQCCRKHLKSANRSLKSGLAPSNVRISQFFNENMLLLRAPKIEKQKQEMFEFAGVKCSKMNVRVTGQGSVMSRKSFSGGGPPRYQLQVVSERRMQAYCRACSPFRLLSNSQSVHKHSFSPVDAHGTV